MTRKRKNPRKQKSVGEILDEILNEKIAVSDSDAIRKQPILNVVIMQLLRREMAGDKSAARLRLRYDDYFKSLSPPKKQEYKIVALENDYTRRLRDGLPPPEHKDD